MTTNTISKNISVKRRNHAEVLVVGAGPAGFGAAVTATRAGKKVTLIEYGNMLGGMWTLGLLSPFFDNANKGGLNSELREQLQKRNAWGGLWNMSFDPVQMAMLLDEYVLDNKIDLLLHTMATDVICEGNILKGIIIANKSGYQAITADVIIDCTGDGDIAARAGTPFEFGQEENGFAQPMTMMFKIGGLKSDYHKDDLRSWFIELKKRVVERKITAEIPFSNPALIKLPRPGEALIQWTHMFKYKGTDGDEITQATLEGRKQIKQAIEYFKLVEDILGKVHLLDIPSVIGVRETRRITGEYVISDDDVKNGIRHTDGICDVTFNIDIHEPESENHTLIKHSGFDIPYRSLVPLNIDNLLVAGRCISGSHVAHAAYRVTGNCLATGEAAGRAASIAIEDCSTVRKIDGSKINI